MDVNLDGVLSREELRHGLQKMGSRDPDGEAERIFDLIDVDHSGCISFTEWCAASMDKAQMLNKDRLRAAFNMFDLDMSGDISVEEVRCILIPGDGGNALNIQVFTDMVKEMDEDGDGLITFEEFENVMNLMMPATNYS